MTVEPDSWVTLPAGQRSLECEVLLPPGGCGWECGFRLGGADPQGLPTGFQSLLDMLHVAFFLSFF